MPRQGLRFASALFASLLCTTLSCKNQADADRRAEVELGMKRFIGEELSVWHQATADLSRAAPEPQGRGWAPATDAAALEKMKEAWGRARVAYELIEGAAAPMFPESDAATDARYDDFLVKLGPPGDASPFDGEGVTGMHAIERILWADSTPAEVTAFEKGLPGYRPAAFPANEGDARAFKRELVARMETDVDRLSDEFQTLNLDVAFAFRGLIDLAAEQAEKVDRAATGREESRYAQTTMRDLRANHSGCLRAYGIFRPWLLTTPEGASRDGAVAAAFARLKATYDAVPGDAIPRPPATWSGVAPTPQDLETPFGKLFASVKRESDDKIAGSLHESLLAVATALGMPEIVLR